MLLWLLLIPGAFVLIYIIWLVPTLLMARQCQAKAKAQGQANAERMLENGGPHTLEEYLCIFPTACESCGSREVVVEVRTPHPGPENRVIQSYVRMCCERCGSRTSNNVYVKVHQAGAPPYMREATEELEDGVRTIVNRAYYRVRSPYLDDERSQKIPEPELQA